MPVKKLSVLPQLELINRKEVSPLDISPPKPLHPNKEDSVYLSVNRSLLKYALERKIPAYSQRMAARVI